MLVKDSVKIGEIVFTHIYSDSGFKIRYNDKLMDEDAYRLGEERRYVETDIPIDAEAIEKEYANAGRVMMGVEATHGSGAIVERALILRQVITDAVQAMQSDADAMNTPELYPFWSGNGVEYIVGVRVRYTDKLYRVIQNHTSQPDWTPDVTVSLFVEISDSGEEWPDWKQPAGVHDAYEKGDKVSYKGAHYISDVDANVWSPDIYGWTEVAE